LTDLISYAIDLLIGSLLIWLGLHYASRPVIWMGAVVIGLAIAAQNARFAADRVIAASAWIGRRRAAFREWRASRRRQA
jgi:hypothetical protein